MKHRALYSIIGLLIGCLMTSCLNTAAKPDKQNPKSIQHKPKTEAPQFTNTSRIPLIANCKDNYTEACLQNTISDRILIEANKRNLKLENDTLQIGVRFNKDGSISTLKNNTTNSELKIVVDDVLNTMETIEPADIESINSYETVSYSWFVLIKDNVITNRF